MKTFAKSMILSAALVAAGVAVAQEPTQNIGGRHGNLRAAQQLVREAYDYVSNAQAANEFDLGGHAGRAKEFLRQANDELKMAAETANDHER